MTVEDDYGAGPRNGALIEMAGWQAHRKTKPPVNAVGAARGGYEEVS
ncbi:hypothetical protein [Chromobacterium paludis]|nr:hypothetical protein [Chromobacterium paludis]